MALSPLAEIRRNTMMQTCIIRRYAGADPTGQPVYHSDETWPCRLAIRTERNISDTGDYISNSTVTVILPADCSVQAYDQIDLPQPYDQGAIIREVTTATDVWGNVAHKVVRIA